MGRWWLGKINYTILLENKQETQKGALRFIVKKPNGEESVVVILRTNPMAHIHLLI